MKRLDALSVNRVFNIVRTLRVPILNGWRLRHRVASLCVAVLAEAGIAAPSESGGEAMNHLWKAWWVAPLFLALVWVFFLFRLNVFGRGGYRDYLQMTQQQLPKIEHHLRDISESLRKIAASTNDRHLQ